MQAASLASSPALRYEAHVTSWPSPTREVRWRQRRQHGEGLEHVGRLAPGHGLDVVVDPQVVVAQRLGQSGQFHRTVPGVGPAPPAVLELPSLGDEDPDLQGRSRPVRRAHAANSHHWTSHIMGRR